MTDRAHEIIADVLQRRGVRHAQLRRHDAEQIVAALTEAGYDLTDPRWEYGVQTNIWGMVTFERREDAERAIKDADSHGIHYLKVEPQPRRRRVECAWEEIPRG